MKTSDNLFEGLAVCAQAICRYGSCGCVMSAFLDKGQLRDAARRLLEKGYFIEDITGVDFAEGIEVQYHFDHYDRPGRVTLRVLTSRDNPEAPSISDIFSGAQWHERECFDFFGVRFTHHPQFRPLLLPADLKSHPLLKPEKNRISLYGVLEGCEPPGPAVGERYRFAPPETAADVQARDTQRETPK